ncbi:MAG: excinuclease ABC subunit UvrA, partial [bacterium]|nr:excinuclease ABC subunit UvrA [bacterium]
MHDIEITGAKKHNLKNINLSIPKKQLIVITGVSGSGKSSLAYDTVFQEGQRKYLESLSIYSRQFIKSLEKPEVQSIKGIAPTISIDQKHSSFYYNSTVGTISEISQYLRLLFSRIGEAFCPGCKKKIEKYSPQRVMDYIYDSFQGLPVYILAPVVKNRKGHYKALFEKYIKRGFLKALVDGEMVYLDDVPKLNRNRTHDIAVQIDAVKVTAANRKQLEESLTLAAFESDGEMIIRQAGKHTFFSNKLFCPHCNISIKEPQPAGFSLNSPAAVCPSCSGRGEGEEREVCRPCKGSGYNDEALSFYFKGKNIYQLGEMEVRELAEFFRAATLTPYEEKFVAPLFPHIIRRLESFVTLNLGYISLNRKINTLSGGELQRARLVSQIGFSLSGIIYILDEPSIGMHMAEQENLVSILRGLREKGNTVIVVEHDAFTIGSADYIIDLGPGSGELGGDITYAGWYRDFEKATHSLTSDYMFNRKKVDPPRSYSPQNERFIDVSGISINNISHARLKIPLKALTVVTGVSGSGKSSLVLDAFYPIIRSHLEKDAESARKKRAAQRETNVKTGYAVLDNMVVPVKSDVSENNQTPFSADPALNEIPGSMGRGAYREVSGTGEIGRVLMVDQGAIGKNARSCPATYIDIMPHIRQLFAGLTESKIRGYLPGRFSYNTAGGRCEACKGLGYKKLEMSFLPELEIICPVCGGRRYNSETLAVKYNGRSIADVLELTAHEAYELFCNIPMLAKKIKVLSDVGLGYLKLGQSSVTLSGGESQRIKLCKELARSSVKPTIYLLDEPTVGLHFDDIRKLVEVFQALIVAGHTVIIIEHNMDIIRSADYLVDLGPGGGKNGGTIIYQGLMEGLKKIKK